MNTFERLLRAEARMWASLASWLLRRPRCEPDETPFGWSGGLTRVLGAFIGVSLVELPILHLLLSGVWRVIADILSAYGLLWMIGLLASFRTTPHALGPRGLRVRAPDGLDLTIAWDYIRSVSAAERGVPGKGRQLDGTVLCVGVMKGTQLDIAFRHPTILELPEGDSPPLTGLRIAADDPVGLVDAARAFLAAPPRPATTPAQPSAPPAVPG
jgi:hypothetical protein